MIYTVTLNPSLDYIVSVKDFELGITNRTNSEQMLPGGKGINVSAVLKNLGIESTALGFTAGFTGIEIEKRLLEMGVRTDFIRLEDGVSRINVKLKSIEGTEINGAGPYIPAEKFTALMERLERSKEEDILFLAGSIPSSMPKDAYQRILERLKDKKLLTVVDASGEELVKVLPYRPFLIKPNNYELGDIFHVTLHTRKEVIPYGKKLQKMGAKNVLISLAGEGAVLLAETGEILEAKAPKGELVNGVGAGDSMVAGFMAAWMEKQDYEAAFRLGVAAGSASAFSQFLATKEEIRNVCERTVIKKLPLK